MKSLYDKVEQICVALAFHPFAWALQIDRDARDKSVCLTVGPLTIGINW